MAGELPKGLCPIDAVGAYKRPASVQGRHAVCCAPLQVASNRTDPTLDQWLAGRGKPALEYTAEYQQVAIAPPAPATACLSSPEGSIVAGRQVLGSHLQRRICSIVDLYCGKIEAAGHCQTSALMVCLLPACPHQTCCRGLQKEFFTSVSFGGSPDILRVTPEGLLQSPRQLVPPDNLPVSDSSVFSGIRVLVATRFYHDHQQI